VRIAVIAALLATPLHAAVIRGIVTENLTGSPLARTVVQIQPIAGTPGAAKTIRAGERGAFEFGGLAAGAWILRAARPGYLPLENGQRRWDSAGFPLILADDDAPFVSLKLQRTAAINGTVRDENEVGIRGFDVAAYRATQPPVLVARGKSDDRGVYRISGLDPGTYYVRSTAHTEEELNFIPTFTPSTIQVENARLIEVFADEEARNFDLRPLQGKLFRLSGSVVLPLDDVSEITVTLASEMIREVQHGPRFSFTGLAPGDYEIYAEAHENPPGTRMFGGYARFTLSKDTDNYVLSSRDVRETQFTFTPDRGRGAPPGQLFARRKDLAGVGPIEQVDLTERSALIAPGGWEFLFLPESGNYVSSFSGGGASRGRRSRADGWNAFVIGGFSFIRYGLSSGGAVISGVVKQGGEPVLGAPVFLEAWDPATRSRLVELVPARADLHGAFRFEGLPPGMYRIFSSFEYGRPDSAAFDLSGAISVPVDAHQSVARDLELYGARF
jgi:hypothetical protein